MSSGIAHPGSDGKPTPLPAQALDYGTGFLIAAAACRALTDARASARLSLARTARLLVELGLDGDTGQPRLGDDVLEQLDTGWGPVKTAREPASIKGCAPRYGIEAGPLGRHPAAWQ